MKDRLPLILTVAVLAVLIALGALRSRRGDPVANAAAATIGRALRAAVAGDVDSYLACFGEPLRGQLERAVAESGRPAYAASLQARASAMTGWAVTALPASSPGSETRWRVEVVCRDRNEVQDYAMRLLDGSWRIADLGAAASVQMPIAYGIAVGSEGAVVPSGRAGKGTP